MWLVMWKSLDVIDRVWLAHHHLLLVTANATVPVGPLA
jgi:hypothetical protein